MAAFNTSARIAQALITLESFNRTIKLIRNNSFTKCKLNLQFA